MFPVGVSSMWDTATYSTNDWRLIPAAAQYTPMLCLGCVHIVFFIPRLPFLFVLIFSTLYFSSDRRGHNIRLAPLTHEYTPSRDGLRNKGDGVCRTCQR